MKITDPTSTPSRFDQTFQMASEATGTSFDYLVRTAQRESSLRPDLKAQTSSATGLFQFVEQTWLWMMKEEGGDIGLPHYAEAIERTGNGRFDVADKALKAEILELRRDPMVASIMAGRLTQKNAAVLTDRIGRPPSDGELYIAHFMGAGGGSRLINLAQQSPDSVAAASFPAQAAANKSIFYAKDGRARSTSEVYRILVRDHGQLATAVADASAKVKAADPADLAVSARVAATHAALSGFGAPTVGGGDSLDVNQRVAQAFAATTRSGTSPSAPHPAPADVPANVRVAQAFTGNPVASDASPAAPKVGWAARSPADAFSALLRNDTASQQAPSLQPPSAMLGFASEPRAPTPGAGVVPATPRPEAAARPSRLIASAASQAADATGAVPPAPTERRSRFAAKTAEITTGSVPATPATPVASALAVPQTTAAAPTGVDGRPLDLTAFLKYQAPDPATKPKKPLLPPI